VKYIIFMISTFLFVGCGINDKTSTTITCKDNILYQSMYKARLVDRSEDIVKDDYLVQSAAVVYKGKTFECKK